MDNKQDKGFTLVELLIVIVILGILATVTVFAVRGITDQGQTSACDADEKTLQTAIEAYYAQNGDDDSRVCNRRPTGVTADLTDLVADLIVARCGRLWAATQPSPLTYRLRPASTGAADGESAFGHAPSSLIRH